MRGRRPGLSSSGCGADLAGARDVGIERSHQVHDLPEVRIKVWQHDVFRVRCGCGAEHVGQLPDGVSTAPSSYGVNLKSLAVYLLVYQHVPVQRCVQLIADLTGGTGPSDGFVHGMLARCATAAETYPDAHWPPQALRALRGLISAWHAAREAARHPRGPYEGRSTDRLLAETGLSGISWKFNKVW